jgi:predicted nuclease with TOPRIM domain
MIPSLNNFNQNNNNYNYNMNYMNMNQMNNMNVQPINNMNMNMQQMNNMNMQPINNMNNNNLMNELNKYKEENMKLKQQINNLQREINKLNNKLQNANQSVINIQQQQFNYINEINNLKLQLNNKNKDGYVNRNNIMVVHFLSGDGKINQGIYCLKTDTFAQVEEKLYQIYAEYRDNYNNTFLARGNVIKRFKTMSENNIKNGDKIQLQDLNK